MAHSASVGSVKRTVDVPGKRLGVKKYGGEFVKSGNIIIRQRGSKFHAGRNTMMGKDFTIFAVANGFVSFRLMTGYKRGKKFVDVVDAAASVAPVKKTEKVEVKAEVKTETKATSKRKPAVKKTTAKKATK